MNIGHELNYYDDVLRRIGQTNLGQVGNYFLGKNLDPFARGMGKDVAKVTNLIPGVSQRAAVNVGRFAGRAVPLLSAIGNITDVADIIAGDESLGNKAMDATAMTISGFLGSAVPVVGTGLGIAAGKMVSDGTQWLFGDKKSPEERRMEEALAMLQGRGMYG